MSKVKREITLERFRRPISLDIFVEREYIRQSFRARASHDLCAGGADNGDDDESVVNRFVSKFPRSFALSPDEGKSFF